MENSTQQTKSLMIWFIAAYSIVFILKVFLAAVLDLYSDEIFYWFASTRLALAYSDLPFMTALLAGLGSSLDSGNPLAVRSLFLLLGSSLPFVVYWIALPISNHRQALESAVLTLCLPLGGFLGLLAVPDVPLIFFGLLSIGFFQRALQHNQISHWIATGIFVGLGLSTHYRFFLYPLAAIIFLALYTPARQHWRNPKLWCAIAIASLGLIPILWFNLSNQLSSASFYLIDRHPWEFQAGGLLHAFKQAGLVSPPLYILFLFCLWCLFKQAREGEQNSFLLLSFAATNLSVYLILAPWTDADSTSIHWPLSGYFPLLIAAPQALRQFNHWAELRWQPSRARKLTLLIPACGFTGTLIALLGVGSQGFQLPLQSIVGTGVLSDKMAGWREFSAYSAPLFKTQFSERNPVVITDNYYTAAQVQFAGLSNRVFTLDRDKAVRDGRITQLILWGMDESGLADLNGQPALYINEDSTLILAEKIELMSVMCDYSSSISTIDELSLFNGDKAFSYYRVDSISSAQNSPAFPCPYPIQAWIDRPSAGSELQGEVEVAGWAFSEDIGIESVSLLINGEFVAHADYGIEREDVVSIRNVRTDPNSPNLGFGIRFDSRDLINGRHEMSLLIKNNLGTEINFGARPIAVNN